MKKVTLLALFAVFPIAAFAAPDCSPNLRAKGLYQCESQSHEGSPDRPRKSCVWNKQSKECTCCIANDEDSSADESERFD